MIETVNDKILSTVDKYPSQRLPYPFPNKYWSMLRNALPINLSLWNVAQGLLMGFIFVYLQRKIVLNLEMIQNKEQKQID